MVEQASCLFHSQAQHLPDSRFPIPCSLNKKNSVKFWLIPILDRIIFCNSQEP
ncbi:MAG: hypothetical protein F6K44_22125 [Moorea sp. SIO3E2]|nr:hypothetical protein [Moorena sp. SIO3E2]